MAHVSYLEPTQVSPEMRGMYGQAEQAFGMLLNIFKAGGHSPELTRTMLAAFGGLGTTTLDGKLRELAYIASSTTNSCQY